MTLRQIGQLILMSALYGAVFLLIKYAFEDPRERLQIPFGHVGGDPARLSTSSPTFALRPDSRAG